MEVPPTFGNVNNIITFPHIKQYIPADALVVAPASQPQEHARYGHYINRIDIEEYTMEQQSSYKYKVATGDTLWSLANEYIKIKTNITNSQAQKIIRDLNPHLKTLKLGQIINLPFDKGGANALTAKPKTSYEKWQDTVNMGITDTRWDQYDDTIKAVVSEFNSRLGKKSRYAESPMPRLDWKWVKAVIWVESGGPSNPMWKTRPMQIGNPNDKGLGVLKRGDEASNIVMDEKLKANLIQINTPTVNIKAGTAYLLNRLSRSTFKSLRSGTDKTPHEYTVISGDSFDKIAKKNDTTIDELKKSNPAKVAMIKPGDKLKYYKAKSERVIHGWRAISALTIAGRYNVGDPKYSKKLTYVFNELLPKKEAAK